MTEEKIHEEKKHEHKHETKHEVKHVSKPHASKKKETITISKVALWQIISVILIALLVASIYTGGFGSDNVAGTKTVKVDTKETSGDGTGLADDDAVKGDPDAPVTIVEWSDFECPYCTRFYDQAYQQIITEYVDTGKVKFVYRDFPLSFHANAQKAAEAAECAGEQGKFYDMHDLLFEEGVSGGVSAFKQFAVDLGLDTEAFNECLDSDSMAAEVAADMQAGVDAGVRGTPGFVINGELLSGAQPFSEFQKIIEAALE